MKKLHPKVVFATLKANNITLDKREFEKFVKDLGKDPNAQATLDKFVQDNKK